MADNSASGPPGARSAFTRNDFMLAPQKYSRLLYLLASEPTNANALAEAMGMGVDLDIYSKLLSNSFNLWDRNLLLINWCIESEFKTAPVAQSGSLMRGNTFLSKLESEFARKHGTEYLKLLFSDLIREVITQEQSLDIDASRGNISETILQDRIIKLKLLAQRFFAKITSEDMRRKMPRLIRAIAGMTRLHAKAYYPNSPTSPLIGGFLMLRYFAPALVTPEAFGLLGPDEVPTPKARANLILIAKVLQNISNGLKFETTKKEEHMKPLDDFVSAQFKLMDLYYQSIADDPMHISGQLAEPWSDLLDKPLTPEMIQIDKIGLPDLFQLHRLIYRFKNKFLATLNAKGTNSVNGPSGSPVLSHHSQATPDALQNADITQLLQILGPPPSIQGSTTKASNVVPGAADFVYLGRPNKAGHAVFYIIVCKIDLTIELDALVAQTLQYITSNSTPTAPLCLVLDVSWANTHDVKRKFFASNRFFSNIQERIPIEMKKRIREIHLVHPTGVNNIMMFLFRTFVSKKFFSKVHEHNKWKTLADWIELSKIDLPEESKSYITKAYRVTKVNAKGKRQLRIVKFTDNSILNIDPSSGVLKNEKLLDDIEDITLTSEGEQTTIVMNFSAGSAEKEASRRKKSLFGQFGMKDKADLTTRTYICATKMDAERFMEDVFEAAYRAQKLQEPLEYKVVKVNEVGKHQDRTFKLTCDSLLNLDGNKIRTEISFVGIKSVDCDKYEGKVLWIQLKHEFGPRRIIFDDAAQRNAMFMMLTTRVLHASGSEDDEAAQMKFETALWRIKESAPATIGVHQPGSAVLAGGGFSSASGTAASSSAASPSLVHSSSANSLRNSNSSLRNSGPAPFSASSTANGSPNTSYTPNGTSPNPSPSPLAAASPFAAASPSNATQATTATTTPSLNASGSGSWTAIKVSPSSSSSPAAQASPLAASASPSAASTSPMTSSTNTTAAPSARAWTGTRPSGSLSNYN
jgi:hypothetical protein